MTSTKGNNVALKNPVGKLAETALSTLKDPKGAAGRVVDQAKGAVALGKIAADTAGSVVGRAARKGKKAPARPQAPTPQARQESTPPTGLRAVPDVNEPAHTQPPEPAAKAAAPAAEPEATKPAAPKPAVPKPAAQKSATANPAATKPAATKPAAAKPQAKKSADSPKKQGDPVVKAPAKKSAAKKSPATKKVAATPADVAEVVEAAVAEDPRKTAAQPAKKAASPTAKKSAANKAPAKKSSPGGKLPARKSPTAGGSGTNPSTGKPSATQASEGSVVDPSVAKQVSAESETLKKAAETNPS